MSPEDRIYLATIRQRLSGGNIDKSFDAVHQKAQEEGFPSLPAASGQSATRQRSLAKNQNMKAL
jgi:hypothetical protein